MSLRQRSLIIPKTMYKCCGRTELKTLRSWALNKFTSTIFHNNSGKHAIRLIRTTARLARTASGGQSRYMPPSTALRSMLASRSITTTLYLAPKSNIYLISTCSIGTFCLAYGIFNIYDTSINQQEGLWWMIPILMNFVSAFMLVVGCAALFRSRNVVKYVRAVPITDFRGRRSLMIEIEARQLFPVFRRGKLVTCGPDDVVLKARVRRALEELPSSGAGNKRTGGFFGLEQLFHTIRALTSGDGFLTLNIKGTTWRMDIENGQVLDSGQLFDRLFRYEG